MCIRDRLHRAPPALRGPRERPPGEPRALPELTDRPRGPIMLGNFLKKMFGTQNERIIDRIRPTVDRVNALESSVSPLSDDRLAAKIAEFRQRVVNGEPLDDLLPETFAVVREAGKRVLEMRHFDVQLMLSLIHISEPTRLGMIS